MPFALFSGPKRQGEPPARGPSGVLAPMLLGRLMRFLPPRPPADKLTPPTMYDRMGQVSYDPSRQRTIIFGPVSRVSQAFAAAYHARPTHWANPANIEPQQRYQFPILRGKQNQTYARTRYGTSRYQFQHLYLSSFTPAVFKMDPYYQILKYAITPKRVGTFGVVPLQAQGQVQKRASWRQTIHGFPVQGSWPMGISS